MSVINLEAVLRSKYHRPARWAVPEGLPPFTTSLFVIFRGLGECPRLYVVRHFGISPQGLVPLLDVDCGGTLGVVRAHIPPGSVRFAWPRRHPTIYEIWLPPLVPVAF